MFALIISCLSIYIVIVKVYSNSLDNSGHAHIFGQLVELELNTTETKNIECELTRSGNYLFVFKSSDRLIIKSKLKVTECI